MKKSEFLNTTRVCADILWNSNRHLRICFIISVLLDLLVVAFSVAAPTVLKNLIDSFNSGETGNNLALLGVGYGLTWLAAEVFVRIKVVIGTEVIEEVKKQASSRFCMNTIFEWHAARPGFSPGVFSTKLNQINSAIPVFLDGLMGQVLPLIVRLCLSVAILVQFVPDIYSIALIVVVGSFAGVSLFTFSIIGDRQRAANGALQSAFGLILDVLKNRELIIAHAEEEKEITHIEQSLGQSKKSIVSNVYVQQLVSTVQIVLLGAGLAGITALAAYDLAAKTITLGDFVQVNAYLLQFVLPVSYFGMVISGIKRSSVTLGENSHLLERNLSDFSTPSGIDLGSAPRVSLSNVSLHDSLGVSVLNDVSFEVESGRSLAIVGPSGAGKTTLIKTLVGLSTPTTGEIAFDRVQLTPSNIRQSRKNVGYVPQDDYLLDRSVYENVSSRECKDDSAIYKCLNDVGLKLDARQDARAISVKILSGGEKQRVSLARAIARKAKVIIFDEPTSSLDIDSKKIIEQVFFGSLAGETTRIIVTHDLNEAKKADAIVVLEGGCVSATGDHATLMLRPGWYRRQWLQLNPSVREY
ncbi:ATP-binding cassette domain-containing protein [Pseudomonas sp. GZD-222]|uniref:ATP-binding cassette domain-containing protein n=1 Tax=Pseudomonas sp. GZD-222 TaxID=3404805 RepID=UPI003BB5FC6C